METLFGVSMAEIWSKCDVRVDDWLFMSSPIPTAIICISYVVLVTVAGPRFMQHREPYNLRAFLIIYNFLQATFNAFLFYEVGFMALGSTVYKSRDYEFSRCSIPLETKPYQVIHS